MKTLTVAEFTSQTEGGRIFSVDFIKRTTGEERKMNCRRGVSKGVKGVGLAFDPGPKALLPVYDLQAEGHRFVSLDSLQALRLAGTSYAWNAETERFEERA